MRTPRLRLRSTIGRNYDVDPNDTRDTKTTLRDLGYFETLSIGVTPYPDADMFEGIEDFQDDFDLRKDGVMTPNGETERKLNEVIDLSRSAPEIRPSPVAPSVAMPKLGPSTGDRSESSTPEPSENDREQVVALPAVIPIIVYEIAIYFGMSLAAAYAWWLSRSPEEKRRVRAQILRFSEGGHSQNPSDAECEALFKIDIDTCRQIAKKRGRQAGQRCYASANER
jgi:hypothetical protein